ncbi:MBL fold metallo-hydrolase [Rhodoplanes sp. TEM]|uniref:MBL fold metallo-hydrolase n=1 Tax=Rhodoplanes tepidamans TaxID=200616 RepID=A0ABT5JHK2_RHOTP|nr:MULTISPECIES: MBL fold metallo-hydrolase [Rhodoplanes]MDC7789189.1 MBL fold metallo-hydrolase [Rhodoplanes tepidamans]MDC7984627.1 MBL fold metallo-hydrolase [Rhodoplanes sp. TEM]MDQ0355564.1 glyoxylase-like metal-dependent hydrolase (beta-lactamase superfamily II) [Rhodoplanes tepidamans]
MKPPTPESQLQPVGAGAYVWLGADGESNAGAIDTGDSLLVVDTQQNESLARAFRAALAEQLGKPVRAVVNTHYHLDHVAGNGVFAGSVPIVAHERTAEAFAALLGANGGQGWTVTDLPTKSALCYGETFSELVADDPPARAEAGRRLSEPGYERITIVPPTHTFSDRFAFHLPEEVVRLCYFGPAHCDGDVVVHLEHARVVFLGDLFFHGRFPWLGDCDLDGWIRVLDCVLSFEIETVIPGHGPPGTLRDLARFRDLLTALRDAVATAIRAGASEEQAARDVRLPRFEKLPRYAEWIGADVRSAYRYLRGKRHG